MRFRELYISGMPCTSFVFFVKFDIRYLFEIPVFICDFDTRLKRSKIRRQQEVRSCAVTENDTAVPSHCTVYINIQHDAVPQRMHYAMRMYKHILYTYIPSMQQQKSRMNSSIFYIQ